MWSLLAQSDFIDPSQGPDATGAFEVSPRLFFILLGIGFGLGMIGHLTRIKTLVAAGVLMVFLSTILIPLALHATR